MAGTDPRQLLAARLRALREDSWPGNRITQPALARALGGVSPALVSSWESQARPRIPPLARLDAYAMLFATARSFDGPEPGLIGLADMSDEERRAAAELKRELTRLRSDALRSGVVPGEPARSGPGSEIRDALNASPLRFEDGNDITIICSEWPPEKIRTMPYADISDPDYIELLTCPELDALYEVWGHLRAANPTSRVTRRIGGRSMESDDYTSHLVSLGGIDWNPITNSALARLGMPVRQVADWGTEGGQYFEVEEGGVTAQHRPVLVSDDGRPALVTDVALFARAVNPFNSRRSLTICSGMYARGTYGAARALTDVRFGDRNADYIRSQFGENESYCILMQVEIESGRTMTPDWTIAGSTLFEWQG